VLLGGGEDGRWEDGVDCYLTSVLEHLRNEFGQVWTRKLQAGVGVGFNEPGVQLLVQHEVIAEDLQV